MFLISTKTTKIKLKAHTKRTGLNISFNIVFISISFHKSNPFHDPHNLSANLNTFNKIIIGKSGIIIHNIINLNRLNKKIKNIITVKKTNIAPDSHIDKNKSHQSVIALL